MMGTFTAIVTEKFEVAGVSNGLITSLEADADTDLDSDCKSDG